MAASLPWAPDASGEGFTLSLGAFRRPGLSGFAAPGATAIVRRTLPAGTLEIVAGPPEALPDRAVLVAWVEAAAQEMASLFGRFRGGRLQVVVRGVPALEAVPFGQTFRGGGASVALLVSRALDAEAARADWVAVHEMFHTGLPAMRPEDAWLYEGLASYYQNVLRLRGGRATPSEAWRDLADGFRRGRGAQTGRTLADEARDMRQTHAYWSVYWGGGAVGAAHGSGAGGPATGTRRPGRGHATLGGVRGPRRALQRSGPAGCGGRRARPRRSVERGRGGDAGLDAVLRFSRGRSRGLARLRTDLDGLNFVVGVRVSSAGRCPPRIHARL
jgi:hypothetical protein